MSELYRAHTAKQCGLTLADLAADWWTPTPEIVAFFYVADDFNDARYTPAGGDLECG